MKKMIGYIGAYLLFYVGDLVSKLMFATHAWFLYSAYNHLMGWSADVQDWADIDGPWGDWED